MVVLLEWPDLDPRLGYRSSGDWSPGALGDIVAMAAQRLARLQTAVSAAVARVPLVVSLPTLPFPPCSFQAPGEASVCELRIRAELAAFAAAVVELPRAVVVSQDALDTISPMQLRADLRAELASGFPYSRAHAEALAALCATALAPALPKKGLITDLDNTLWRGIIGDDGVQMVSWTLEAHGQQHGIYQQFLNSLAGAGVLVGIASKNEPDLVERALRRPDLVLDSERVFPIEVHWEAKSESVSRILRIWNVGPDSVVFVDDSPMELAEVRAAHPEIECLLFPGDPGAIPDFLRVLRERFGKRCVREEDGLRARSLRQSADLKLAAGAVAHIEALLAGAEARMRLRFGKVPADGRALELINKTNQFNLNGRRISEGRWGGYLAGLGVELMTVEYEDRFGRLGNIAVVAGRSDNGHFHVDHWVMSCRAFARRIEYGTLAALFQRFECTSLCLDFEETGNNRPIQTFLSSFATAPSSGPVWIERDAFEANRPTLYHTVEIVTA
jgi:FkbH-like protein